MAPPTHRVRLLDNIYNVELFTEEMTQIVLQINSTNEAIRQLQSQINQENRSVLSLNQQLLTLYIQQTGTFPNGGRVRGDPRDPHTAPEHDLGHHAKAQKHQTRQKPIQPVRARNPEHPQPHSQHQPRRHGARWFRQP